MRSLLAEEIERLDGLLGQADDPFRREHGAAPQGHRQNNTGAAQFVIPAQSNATSAGIHTHH